MKRFCIVFLIYFFSTSLWSFEHRFEGVPFSLEMKKAPLNVLKKPKPVIILDPGHGGEDEGAKVRSIQEKKIALRTCYLAKRQIEALGYKVILTRARDIFLSLKQRVAIANRRRPALFVSIHYNASMSPVAKGIEIYYPKNGQKERLITSKQLADCILFQLIDQTAAVSRGVKPGNFQVIRETTIPAILIEAGFITNVEERRLLSREDYLERIAKGIAQGIEKHLKS